MKHIFLNGPPRSGKDTASRLILDIKKQNPVLKFPYKFATPLYRAIPAMFLIGSHEWDDMYEHHKETPQDILMGMTPREAMIWLSEEVMKPKFGKDSIGRIMAREVKSLYDRALSKDQRPSIAVWSDCGFADEVTHIVEAFGPNSCYLVRLERNGCTYASDSRSYLTPESIGISEENFFLVENNGTLSDLESRLEEVVDIILNKE